ncbi:hypothetical protein HK102_013613, partial [Quaeritorhiza haematococci]
MNNKGAQPNPDYFERRATCSAFDWPKGRVNKANYRAGVRVELMAGVNFLNPATDRFYCATTNKDAAGNIATAVKTISYADFAEAVTWSWQRLLIKGGPGLRVGSDTGDVSPHFFGNGENLGFRDFFPGQCVSSAIGYEYPIDFEVNGAGGGKFLFTADNYKYNTPVPNPNAPSGQAVRDQTVNDWEYFKLPNKNVGAYRIVYIADEANKTP